MTPPRKRISLITILFPALFLSLGANAQTWTPVPEIGRVTVNHLLGHEGLLYAATVHTVFRSTDNGRTWTAADHFPKVEPYADVFTVVATGDRMFAATTLDGVYASTDRGVTWSTYSEGLEGMSRNVYGLALRGDSLYAATSGAGVYVRQLGNGQVWRPFNPGLSWGSASRIIGYGDMICAFVANFAFIHRTGSTGWTDLPWDEFGNQRSTLSLHVHEGLLFGGTETGVFRWDGNEPRWTRLSLAPAPDRGVRAMASTGDTLLAILQLNPGRHLIAISGNDGDSWSIIDDTQGEVHSLLVSDGMLWSARTDGLWFRPLDAAAGTPVPPAATGIRLQQPWPHPAAGTATVAFDLDRMQAVTLSIHDVLGRGVATLADGTRFEAGTHHVTADLAGLPPGLYIVRLATHESSIARTLLLR